MKNLFIYYAVDTLTETILGSFQANNDEVAKKILTESFKKNDKLQYSVGSTVLMKYGSVPYEFPETFDEVLKGATDCHWIAPEPEQKILDFEGKKNG